MQHRYVGLGTEISCVTIINRIINFDALKMPVVNSRYTGLFISPSGISELDCATTKTDTAERSISIGRESLQVFLY